MRLVLYLNRWLAEEGELSGSLYAFTGRGMGISALPAGLHMEVIVKGRAGKWRSAFSDVSSIGA